MTDDPIYQDETWLREKYCTEQLTSTEMAEQAGCAKWTILRWLDEHDIPRRQGGPRLETPPSIHTSNNGYERVASQLDGERDRILVHRLTAVAWFGIDAIEGKDVHHVNNIQWDNREDNLELLTPSEHMSLHNEQRNDEYGLRRNPDKNKYEDPDWLREQYWDKELNQREIAEKCGVSRSVINTRMNQFDIETRCISEAKSL
jgi:DNA-binding XRE family transcriptional regulator